MLLMITLRLTQNIEFLKSKRHIRLCLHGFQSEKDNGKKQPFGSMDLKTGGIILDPPL